MNAMELKRGFHLAVEDSRIIPTGNGVFIEYDGFLSKKMEGLRALLIQCYPDAATRFPEAFRYKTAPAKKPVTRKPLKIPSFTS